MTFSRGILFQSYHYNHDDGQYHHHHRPSASGTISILLGIYQMAFGRVPVLEPATMLVKMATIYYHYYCLGRNGGNGGGISTSHGNRVAHLNDHVT